VLLDIAAFLLLQSRRRNMTMGADARDEPAARIFFALVPPPPLQAALGVLATGVAQRAHGRAVPADNLHVTLAFIGAWPVARLSHWLDVGARCAGAAIDVTLDRLGGFRRAGVAWIGSSAPPPALLELSGALGVALAAANVAVDGRAFAAHLTLARRCRGPFPDEPAGPFHWRVDAISLMRSFTEPAGARYVEVARWPLRKG